MGHHVQTVDLSPMQQFKNIAIIVVEAHLPSLTSAIWTVPPFLMDWVQWITHREISDE
jgi:hypothetical protein